MRVELKIDNKKIRYVTELQGFDPMSVICIETIQGGYLVWYRKEVQGEATSVQKER